MKIIAALAIAGTALVVALPADAGNKNKFAYGVYSDSNPYYLDYKTDLSEAKRELRKDLARANDESDRVDAWAEYHREIADAKHDFAKEMAERGYAVAEGRRGQVTVSDD